MRLQEFRMRLAFSLRSVVYLSKGQKKKRKKDGRKLLPLVSPANSVFHCSHFLFFDSWKIKFFVCFYKAKCVPFNIVLLPPLFSLLSWSCLPFVLYAKGRGFKNESSRKIIGHICGLSSPVTYGDCSFHIL